MMRVIALALVLAGCGGNADPEPTKVAMWGDSTMFGAAPHEPPYDCQRLSPTIPETIARITGYEVVNQGVNGATAPAALTGWSNTLCSDPPLTLAAFLAAHPDVKVHAFAFGINDAWLYGAPDYTKHIRLVRKAGKLPVLVEPFQVEPTAPPWDRDFLPADHMDRIKAVRQSLARYGVPVIRVAALDGETLGANAPDGLHPNQAYADRLGAEIARQLVVIVNTSKTIKDHP